MPRVSSKAPLRAAALFVASAAVLLTAACGGSSDSSSTTNGNTNGDNRGGNNATFTAYLDCLKTNGVTITVPTGGGRNRPSAGASREPGAFPRPSGSAGAGRGDFPGGGGFGGGFTKPDGVDDATWQKAQTACSSLRPSFGPGRNGGGNGRNAAYLNCLKEHGVKVDGTLATEDPAVKKAMQTCEVLRPAPSTAPSA